MNNWKDLIRKDEEAERLEHESYGNQGQIMGDSELSLHSLADFLLRMNTKPEELYSLIEDDNSRFALENIFGLKYNEKFKHLKENN